MKKFLTLLLTVALTATLAITGTIAYLTDTDQEVNVMTLGNVYIEQIEQERDANGDLVPFKQEKPVFPAVYEGTSIQYADPANWIVPNDEAWKILVDNKNVVDKFVTVKNTGKSDAYVRTLIAFEIGKDGYCDPYMHFVANFGSYSEWDFEWTNIKIEEDNSQYLIGVFTHKTALASGATTEPNVKQVYLDKTATNEVSAAYGDTFEIKVLSQAVQTEGFANATTALDTAFGAVDATNVQNWFNNVETPTFASSTDDIKDALTSGATKIHLEEGEYTIPTEIAGKEVTISGNGDATIKFEKNQPVNVSDASITFENLKFAGPNENVMNGFGIQHTTGDIVFKNCTFDGAVTNEHYGNVKYIDCTFTGTGYITTYAVPSATFENCVFDKADSRALLVYSHGDNPCVVKVTDCEFKAAAQATTWQGDWTAAIEVDTTNIPTAGTTVTIENCTHDANYSGLVRDKSAAGKANAVITVK